MLVCVICIAGVMAGGAYFLTGDNDAGARFIGLALAIIAMIAGTLNLSYVRPMAKMSTICDHAGYVEARLYDDGVVSCVGVHDTELYSVVLAEYNEYMGEGND